MADIATPAHMSAFLNTRPKISIRDIQQKERRLREKASFLRYE